VNPVTLNITLLFQVASFLIVLYFLNRWLAKPVTKVMTARQERIREALAAADRAREEAAARQDEQLLELQKARAEGQALIASARQAADQLREEQIAQARADAARLVEQARSAINQEREQTKQELRSYVVDLTIEAARRVIGVSLDTGQQHQLISRTVDEVIAVRNGAAAEGEAARASA